MSNLIELKKESIKMTLELYNRLVKSAVEYLAENEELDDSFLNDLRKVAELVSILENNLIVEGGDEE